MFQIADKSHLVSDMLRLRAERQLPERRSQVGWRSSPLEVQA